MSPIYLDYNSTTPVDERVLQYMLPYYSEFFGNASSKTHSFGWQAEAAVDKARKEVADFLNAASDEIIFTSGATESINIALRGAAKTFKGKKDHIIVSSIEHKAVLDTVYDLEKEGLSISLLKVNREGVADVDELKNLITPKTLLVCLMLANNETGVLQPATDAVKICREKNVPLFCDATQAAGKVMIDVKELKCDLLCISSHKMYGPKGTGALYIKRKSGLRLSPVYAGGGHERGLRPGTLNVAGIAGMGKACTLASELFWEDASRISTLRTMLEQILEKTWSIHINGSIRNRIFNTTNIAFKGILASGLISRVPALAFSTGSACTSALPSPSHVLKAMGYSDEHIHSSVRFSLGRFTTAEQVEQAAHMIGQACNLLKK